MRATLAAIIILAAATLGGCAADPQMRTADAPLNPPPTESKETKQLRLPKPSYGSLFTSRTPDMYTDLRARHVGDLVVVEIVENSKADKKEDTKAEKTSEYEAKVPYFFGLSGAVRRESGSTNADPVIGAETTSSIDAKSKIKKEDTFTSSIGCTVIEVLPGGNLVIRGSRELQVGGQTENIILEGTVRPTDITTNNTVYSTQLADAKIYYTGRGVLSDKQKPGWLARLLDTVWPF